MNPALVSAMRDDAIRSRQADAAARALDGQIHEVDAWLDEPLPPTPEPQESPRRFPDGEVGRSILRRYFTHPTWPHAGAAGP